MTSDEFIDTLKVIIAKAGSQKQAAKDLGISTAYLCDVLHKRRDPGRKIAAALGMRKVITWCEPKDRPEWQYL
jgi:predicted DNA-binding protein (UPF0251 family)